ncbi:MAG: phage major tail tube protein [Oscillospiraceae bacterium]|nr:phage major tail tube protein [Oscillospiraceae bacterium]
MRYEVTTINCMLYEDGNRFVDMASVVLPSINSKIAQLTGAGIAGDVDVPVIGQFDAMETTINLRSPSADSMRLRTPVRHTVELRPAVQKEDTVKGAMLAVGEKIVMVIVPKGLSGITIAPATARDTAIPAAVRYFAHYIEGRKVVEIDPLNYIFFINGVDYGAPVRSAMGL